MQKYEIINALAAAGAPGRYLEICTPTTGRSFGRVDPEQLPVRHRLMYRCPDDHDDGLAINFRTASQDSQELISCISALHSPEEAYDIVFVDPWHTYSASSADLHGGLRLLRPDGVMVVHDCNPTDPETVTPEYRDGSWCGMTYHAFVDFALSSGAAGYCTIDSDFGVGVVFGPRAKPVPGLPIARPAHEVIEEWNAAPDHEQRFACFERHRRELLNLITPAQFRAALGLPQRAVHGKQTVSLEPIDSDRELAVIADGVSCLALDGENGWHRFALPAGALEVILVSRAFTPAERNGSPDQRQLGLAVRGVRICAQNTMQQLPLRDLPGDDGWHEEETATDGLPWRWTNGRARIPIPRGATLLEVLATSPDTADEARC